MSEKGRDLVRAVVLAGGRGTRLRPYTKILPKPLMPIGDMPILEIVLRQLKAAGVTRVTIAAGYLAGIVEAFFRTGDRLGIDVDYSIESEPLGTAGPLAQVDGLDETFLVMNGDVLTDLDYRDLVRFHRDRGAVATIATFVRNVQIDFGVLETDAGGLLTGYLEKPTFEYQVSMGIYVFEPELLRYITPAEYLDFPDLVRLLLARSLPVASYPFSGYWLDLGRYDDYERAVEEFTSRRHALIPGE